MKIHETNLNNLQIETPANNKPLRFDEIQDPEAYAFFHDRKYLKKENYITNKNIKPKIIQSSPNCLHIMKNSKIGSNILNSNRIHNKNLNNINRNGSTANIMHRQLYGGKDINPSKIHMANLTASKFRSENFMRSFYEGETKNEKNIVKDNSIYKEKSSEKSNEKNKYFNEMENRNYEEDEKSDKYDISNIKFSEKKDKPKESDFCNLFRNENNDYDSKRDNYDYENVDTPEEKGINFLDPNEKIINTIKLISKNKKNFKETNKILKEIGQMYKEKKDILGGENNYENDADEKMKNYIEEYERIKNENKDIDERIERLSSKGYLQEKMIRIQSEVKRSGKNYLKSKESMIFIFVLFRF